MLKCSCVIGIVVLLNIIFSEGLVLPVQAFRWFIAYAAATGVHNVTNSTLERGLITIQVAPGISLIIFFIIL